MSEGTNLKASFKVRVLTWAEKINVSVQGITVRAMRTKWASCSAAGRLTFDETLLRLDEHLQDYVIVHELLHFNVPNHGRLWKMLMRAHLGAYEAAEVELQRLTSKARAESESRAQRA